MNSQRYALIFANEMPVRTDLLKILQEIGVAPLRPYELLNNASRVAIIILDRPAQNALPICINLRKQKEFEELPILVMLQGAEQEQVAQFSRHKADLFFKPVGTIALRRYLTDKLVTDTLEGQSSRQSATEEGASISPGSTTQSFGEMETETGEAERANAQKVLALEDSIPTSNRLLPKTPVPVQIAKGGVPCMSCRRWKARREDAFCSRCGEPLARLDIPISAVFEPLGEHRLGQLIELKNTGQNPLRMSFGLPANSQLEKRFSLHAAEGVLDGGQAEHLLVTFDARGLELTTRYQTVLEITSNEGGYSKRQVQLVVERLPIPRIVADESCSFVLGIENQWEFRLANDGGGTLTLSKVYLDELDADATDVRDELEILEPVAVKGATSAPVRLRLPQLDLTPGKHPKKLACEFARFPAVECELTVEVIRPARLAVQPPELDLGVVSTGRTRRLSLALVNGGGEELIVEAIASSFEWLECLAQTPLSIGPGGTQLIDVLARGSVELAGNHNGEITVRSNSYQSPTQVVPFLSKFVNPAEYQEYIGIDFGTTASCIAVLDKDDRPFAITLEALEANSQADPRIMPSVLYFQADGTVLAGRDALEEAAIQPNNAVTSIKRVLGRKRTESLAGHEYNATDLTTKVIEQLLLRAEDGLFALGEYVTPRRAVVTVPVEFFDNQRRALLEACERAGLEMHSSSKHGMVIDEAHAAALYYLSRKVQILSEGQPERLLIFDFGGGTLDCALIEIESVDGKVLLKTLAPGGDPRLGGEDIDWALAGLLAGKAKAAYPDFDINCLGDEQKFQHHYHIPALEEAAYRTRARFKRQAEVAKISLVEANAIELSIQPLLRLAATPLEPFLMNGQGWERFDVTVEKEELEAVIEPFLQRASRVVETLCQRAKLPPEEVQTILHVGRTSLLPLVRQRINALMPNAEDRSDLIEPKLCVALGAAFWGYIKDQPNANIEFVGGANRTIHDIGYIDTPVSSGSLRQVFVPVFPSQTEFPCEQVIEFPRAKDWVNLQLAENRGKNVSVEGNPEIKKIGKVRIDARVTTDSHHAVRFAIDENRALEITANGQTQTIEMMDD